MAVHTELTPTEAADRLALRELFDAYAHCADRRDAEVQKALFTDDTRFAVYMDGEASETTYVLEGREALTPVFDDLNRYEATTHFNGQSTVTVDGDRATGESYTIAHHIYSEDGNRKIMIASLRYPRRAVDRSLASRRRPSRHRRRCRAKVTESARSPLDKNRCLTPFFQTPFFQLDTNRNAIYKNLFDARRNLRATMAAAGHPVLEENAA
jgi:SnoaL-like domain